MPKFIKFELTFSEAVVGFLGLFLGAKNLIRSAQESRRRGLFSNLFAAIFRAIGLVCTVVGAFYILTGIRLDFFSRSRADHQDDGDEDDDDDEEEDDAEDDE